MPLAACGSQVEGTTQSDVEGASSDPGSDVEAGQFPDVVENTVPEPTDSDTEQPGDDTELTDTEAPGDDTEDDAAGPELEPDVMVEDDSNAGGTDDPFLDCVIDWDANCEDGIYSCLASETCQPNLGCLAACPDTDCAVACFEDASEADQALLQGVTTCAAFGGCFGLPPAPSCGDGTCGEGEDVAGCPEDCTVADTSCLEDNCNLGSCMSNEECAASITCMAACLDTECVAACIALAPDFAEAMLTETAFCGESAGCFGGEPVPENCLLDSCDASECLDFEECAVAVDCMTDCGDDTACAQECIETASGAFQAPLNDLLECGMAVGCFEFVLTACGNGTCDQGEAIETCPEDCEGLLQFYGVLIEDSWDGVCNPDYNSSGADIGAVELLSCPGGDPFNCQTVAWFVDVVGESGTEGGCQNDFTDPEQSIGPCGCALDQWFSLQGGWLAGDFGDAAILSGMTVRVYEYGASSNGTEDPYTVSLITEPGCMMTGEIEGCTQFLGAAVDVADFVVPMP